MVFTMDYTTLSTYWVVDVDCDFKTDLSRKETRLFHNLKKQSLSYVTVINKTLDKTDGSVVITTSNNSTYKLINEPDINSWNNSVYAEWKIWDANMDWVGKEKARGKYEPWIFLTRAAICGYPTEGLFYHRDSRLHSPYEWADGHPPRE